MAIVVHHTAEFAHCGYLSGHGIKPLHSREDLALLLERVAKKKHVMQTRIFVSPEFNTIGSVRPGRKVQAVKSTSSFFQNFLEVKKEK